MLSRVWGVLKSRRFVAVMIAAAGIGLAGVVVSPHAAQPGGVLGVRLGGDMAETRIVVDLTRATSGKLAADSGRRVEMTLADVGSAAGLQGAGHGLVRAWTLESGPGGARLKIDLAADAEVKRRFLLPPAEGVTKYRYVIDLKARDASVQTAVLTSAPARTARPLSLKRVVVIDAGHGGRDPGASGAVAREKDVTLQAARALKARLERSGRYRVVMTRDADVYVPLESRVQIARREDADLFISLHADAGADAATRGASVYTLSEQATRRAAKFVTKDDWFMKTSQRGDRGVSDILLDLTQRATKNRSAGFAETLLEHISDETQLLRRSHRDAGFVVLLAPDVPAVLLEMGFMTNSSDEAMLRDQRRRTRLMEAVGDAIDDYFAEETRLAAR